MVKGWILLYYINRLD